MTQVVSREHVKAALAFKKYYAVYQTNQDLINMGAYAYGTNPDLDIAINRIEQMNAYLRQTKDENISFEQAQEILLSYAS
jgi:flagellum-specific ATP synthase